MDNKVLLAKSISLLYQESKLTDKTESSADLVRTVLENVQVSEIGIGLNTTREVIIALKSTIIEMCSNPSDHEYDKADLLQRIKINTDNDDKFYEAIKQGLDDSLTEAQLKRTTLNIRKSINNHFKEQQISEILNKASYAFKFQRDKIKDANEFISSVLAQLEPLQITTNSRDPAVVSDIDIGDEGAMSAVFKEIKSSVDGSGIMKTGWTALNEMLQGGFRRGEFVMMGALQHKYKTGFTLSLFKQIALYNQPYMIDTNKKPLLLRISFEDDLAANLQFLYQNLKYNETLENVDMRDVSVGEMAKYVKEKLQVNGYHIKMLRVDPSQWTYKSICNKVVELEAQGYEIHLVMLDYMAMVPTIGCINTGALGTDIRDMIRRLRNFFSTRRITCITPHQLSTDAKQLLRGGMPEAEFVKEVTEKGYWAGSKQLCQEIDVELHIHLFKHNKESYLSVQRGKHRIPTILPEDKKYYMMKFPKGMPIPDDVNTEDSSFRKLQSAMSNAADELFKLG